MTFRLSGRQTQFYIDIIYGIAFSAGFAYLLFVEMDPRVAAFQGGLVLGYFLRVWENVSIYERILEEEIAGEAEDAVAAELEEQVPDRAEEQVAMEVEEQIGDVDERIDEQVHEHVADEVGDLDEQIHERVDERIEEADTQLDPPADSDGESPDESASEDSAEESPIRESPEEPAS